MHATKNHLATVTLLSNGKKNSNILREVAMEKLSKIKYCNFFQRYSCENVVSLVVAEEKNSLDNG